MSYKQAVLRDNPMGLWLLDGPSQLRTYATLLLEYSTYQDYLNNEQSYLQEVGSTYIKDDSAYQHNDGGSFGGNHGAFTVGSPNFQDVMTIITHANYDTKNNGCRITDNVSVDIFNMYNAFKSGYENKTFGIEFWVLAKPNTPINFPLFDLLADSPTIAGSHERMSIYINDDLIYFKINFSDGTTKTTKKQISSWDSPLHIFASVKDKKIKIYVNGLSDETIDLDKNLNYYLDQYSRFRIGPALPGNSFIVNGLAFYDYELSLNQIRTHMMWAHRDAEPIEKSRQTDVSHFSFNNAGKVIFSKKFSTPESYNQGSFLNTIQDNTGVTIAKNLNGGSITGTWIIPISTVSYENFAGIQMSWDTGSYYESTSSNKYVKVEISYDNGSTYYEVQNGTSFPYFVSLYSSVLAIQMLIKVTIFSPDTSLDYQPRIDNLNLNVYSNINELSDSGLFEIAPFASTTYLIKNDNTNILSRGNNLGIKFYTQDPQGNPGSAEISSIVTYPYQSIEFWFQYDGYGSGVLDTGAGNPDLFIDNDSVLQKNFTGGHLYVNGIERNSSPITLVHGEVYHITVVYPYNKIHNILINDSYDGSKSPCLASYGYITIYPSLLTSSEVQARYLSFISVYTGIARDSVTSLGSILEYAGSITNINNGQPISFHRHIF